MNKIIKPIQQRFGPPSGITNQVALISYPTVRDFLHHIRSNPNKAQVLFLKQRIQVMDCLFVAEKHAIWAFCHLYWIIIIPHIVELVEDVMTRWPRVITFMMFISSRAAVQTQMTP